MSIIASSLEKAAFAKRIAPNVVPASGDCSGNRRRERDLNRASEQACERAHDSERASKPASEHMTHVKPPKIRSRRCTSTECSCTVSSFEVDLVTGVPSNGRSIPWWRMESEFDRTLQVLQRYISPVNARSVLMRTLQQRGLTRESLAREDLRKCADNLRRAATLFVDATQQDAALRDIRELCGGSSNESDVAILQISAESDVGKARAEARRICDALGANPFVMQKVATIVSELARNMVLYADGGLIEIGQGGAVRNVGRSGDRSRPGIPNLSKSCRADTRAERAWAGGCSERNASPTTSIFRRATRARGSSPRSRYEARRSPLSLPMVGEIANGDRAVSRSPTAKVGFSSGSSTAWATASTRPPHPRRRSNVFRPSRSTPRSRGSCSKCTTSWSAREEQRERVRRPRRRHRSLRRRKRGATLGPAHSAGFLAGNPRGASGEVHACRAALSSRARIVLFSDGISSRVPVDDVRSLAPPAACDALMQKYRRKEDDATVLVADAE